MKKLGQQIVILEAGFVYVAQCAIEDGYLFMSDARCIRRWGTKHGLGELRAGPTSETILDDSGDVIAPIGKVVHMIKCTKDW